MTKYESGVKEIPYALEQVYDKISDLNNLSALQSRIPDKIESLSFDADSVSFSVPPVGNVSLKIVDREPRKCVKFEATKSPLPFYLWVQLLPMTAESCKMRLTVGAEISPFMKGMLAKPLQEGLEKIATMLAEIHYT